LSIGEVQAQSSLEFLDNTSEDYVEVPSSPLNFRDAITVEAWVSPNTLGAFRTIIGNYDNGSMGFLLRIDGGFPTFWIGTGDGTTWNFAQSPTSIPVNSWSHIAGTLDGNTLSIYVNGVLMKSKTVSGTIWPSANSIKIGGSLAGSDEYMDGVIDELRIWSQSRTQAEIQGSMYSELTGTESGLLAYYDFNEGSGTTLNDGSGNAYNSTGWVGNPTWVDGLDADGDGYFAPYDCDDNDPEIYPGATVCPAPITQGNDQGICGAVVTFAGPTATGCGIEQPEKTNFTSLGYFNGKFYYLSIGEFLPEGAFTDAQENGGNVVTINDADENEFIASVNGDKAWIGFRDNVTEGTFVWENGEDADYVNWQTDPNNGNSDNDYTQIMNSGVWKIFNHLAEQVYILEVDIATQITGLPSGSLFPLGTTTNTFEVTDANGNTSTCSFTVTVEDTEAPTAIAKDITVELDENGIASVTANMIDNGSSDACGIRSIALDKTEFSCDDVVQRANTGPEILYGADVNGNYFRINLNNGESTLVTSSFNLPEIAPCFGGGGVTEIEYDPISNTAYGQSRADCGYGFKFNPETGEIIGSAIITSGGDGDFQGAEVIDGVWYVAQVTTSSLCTFNPDSGIITPVGAFVNAPTMRGMAYDENTGVLYGVSGGDRGGPSLFGTININTGEFSPIVNTGFNLGSLEFGPNGLLYAGESGREPGRIFTIDTSTGITTSIGSTGLNTPISGLMLVGSSSVPGVAVTLTVVDNNGNESTATATVTVEDNIAPLISSVANATRNTDPGVCQYTVDGIEFDAIFTDNCSNTTIRNDFNGLNTLAGESVPKGETIIVWTVDSNGQTETCTTVITVEDKEAPVIVCPADIEVESDPEECGVVVEYTMPKVTDNCYTEKILFASSQENRIYTANLDGSGTPEIFIDNAVGDDIVGVYADYTNNLLYINDGNGRETYVAPLSGGTSGTLLPNSTPPTSEHFAIYVDEPNNRYFFATDTNNGIWVANTDGTGVAEMVITSGDLPEETPHGLDYDPASDMLYFGSFSDAPGIYKVHVGTGVSTRLFDSTDGITGPRGLEIDSNNGKIYWAQHTRGRDASGEIMMGNLDGTGTPIVFATVPTPFLPSYPLLDPESGLLYWSEFDRDEESRIMVAPSDGTGTPSTLHNHIDPDGGYMRGLAFASSPEDKMAITQTSGLPSGSIFPVGTTTNTFEVTDSSGNTATCSFDVIVTDTQFPTVVTQEVTLYLDENGDASTTAEAVNNASFDNCDIKSLSLNKTDFDCSNVGDNTVELTVTDVNGNESVAEANVKVVDDTTPTAIAQEVTLYLDENGDASTTAEAVNNASFDNCEIASLSLSKTDFDCSNVGENIVTLTVLDINGNVATATATVTVEDSIKPIPSTTTLAEITAECEVLEADVTVPTATDNCEGVVSVTHNVSFPITTQGLTVITWSFEDANGNIATQAQDVMIEDSINPIPSTTTLADITAECEVAEADITIPTATDNCGGVVSVSHDASFPITAQGLTVITWSFEDANGNIATQTQDVMLEDVTAPVPDVATLEDIIEECEAITIEAPTATDTCGGSITGITLDPLSYTEEGEFMILWEFNDGNGNITTQEQWVTVKDNTAPEINTQDLTITVDQDEPAVITPEEVNDGSTDNCSEIAFTLDKDTFDKPGVYEVVLTGTDASGNTSQAPATITVKREGADPMEVHVVPTMLTRTSIAKVILPFRGRIMEVQVLEVETNKYKIFGGNKKNVMEIDVAPMKGTLLVKILDNEGNFHLTKLIAL
jgi:hypothetical protein